MFCCWPAELAGDIGHLPLSRADTSSAMGPATLHCHQRLNLSGAASQVLVKLVGVLMQVPGDMLERHSKICCLLDEANDQVMCVDARLTQ